MKKEGLSNTETLSEFLAERMKRKAIECEIVKLVQYNILPGTCSDMGEGDEWTQILEKILDSDIVIFATPVWWGNHSSEIQKVIERLDHLHDEILEGKKSRLEDKKGGVIVTGDSDGAEHIIGNVANFYNAVGITLLPFTSLTVLSEELKKGANTTKEELMKIYEEGYAKTADTMIEQLSKK